jgi:hypothetical protein
VEPEFYVKLRVGSCAVRAVTRGDISLARAATRTPPAAPSSSGLPEAIESKPLCSRRAPQAQTGKTAGPTPNFMTDIRLELHNSQTDALQVGLQQIQLLS